MFDRFFFFLKISAKYHKFDIAAHKVTETVELLQILHANYLN